MIDWCQRFITFLNIFKQFSSVFNVFWRFFFKFPPNILHLWENRITSPSRLCGVKHSLCGGSFMNKWHKASPNPQHFFVSSFRKNVLSYRNVKQIQNKFITDKSTIFWRNLVGVEQNVTEIRLQVLVSRAYPKTFGTPTFISANIEGSNFKFLIQIRCELRTL